MLLRLLPFLATALAVVPPAAAATPAPSRAPLPLGPEGQRTAASATVGPVLAGDAVVFGTRAGTDGAPARLFAAPTTGGPPHVLAGPLSRLRGGDAGVLVRSALDIGGGSGRNDPEFVAGETLRAGPVDGPAQTLGTCVGPDAADGARVAFVGGEHCDQIVVRDVVVGRELGRWPLVALGGRLDDAGLSLAGDHVAWRRFLNDSTYMMVVADLATGLTRETPMPPSTWSFAVAPDGALAFVLDPGGPDRLVLRPADGGPDRALAAWPDLRPPPTVLGFSGATPVLRVRGAASDRVVALTPEGGVRTLVATAPTDLLGADVEDGRLAWMVRDCDEAAVSSAALADLPAGGVDLTAPGHCARPILERTLLRVDRRARTTVAVRCPAACSGTLTLTVVAEPSGGYVRLAQRPFRLTAGRHRLTVSMTFEDRARYLGGRRAARGVLALAGTTGARPSSRFARVTLAPQRGT
jgi:hypothetical protein